MQPYFFPYIGYFQLINSVDKFLLYEHVTFRCKSWMTRNYIKPNNCTELMITIPIEDKSSFKTISELRIKNRDSWKHKTLKHLYIGYKKAPHFDEIYSIIKNIMECPHETLHEFNCNSIQAICHSLDINTQLSISHPQYLDFEDGLNLQYNSYHDRINESAFNCHEKKTARIVHICKEEKASIYHNAINGTKLYSKTDFINSGIELLFIETNPFDYKQFNHSFAPNLSIIDVLMHCGKLKTKELLNAYRLI